MPEAPDITIYVEALQERVKGRSIERVRILGPSVLRSVEPPIEALTGRRVEDVRSQGKRIVLDVTGGWFLVIHLMIAGRLRWLKPGTRLPGRLSQAAFEFTNGTLVLTEAGTKKRATILLVEGESALARLDRGGLEVGSANLASFRETLLSGNHTLKRALCNPATFSGIGNAYSDEILHAAGLSPVTLTRKLSDAEIERLHRAARETLESWTARLRKQFAGRFPGPGEVTAFRDDFAVHGRFGKPCPVCGTNVQRIRYADRETNYCPRCQTGGRVLADRSLSRLLREDWPRTIDAWEA